MDENGLGRLIQKGIVMLFSAYIIFLIILNLYSVVHENAVIYTLIVVPVILLCLLISRKLKISPAVFLFAIFLASFILKGILAFYSDTKPVSDFLTFYGCAEKLLHGNKEWSKWNYFSVWAYQTGPIVYYAILMKLFGTALLPLKLCNCFFMAGTNALIYLIARKISTETAARGAAILYLFYPAPYFLAPVLTNQHFAACLLFAAVYVLLQDRLNLILKGLVAGMLLSIGNVVRPIGIVIVLAYAVWGIIEIVRTRKLSIVRTFAAFLVTYLALSWVFSFVLIGTGISPNGLKNNFPLWKFVVGLNQETDGQFSYKDQNEIFLIEEPDKRNEAAIRAIQQRLQTPALKMAEFLVRKQYNMWGSLDTLRWGFYLNKDNKLVPPAGFESIEPVILKTEKVYFLAIFLILLMGLIGIRKRDNYNFGAYFIMLILMVYFFIHILIEVQVRYRYFAMIGVFILASWGLDSVYGYLKKKHS